MRLQMKKLTTAVFIVVLCHFCFAEIIPLRQAEVLMYHNSFVDLANGVKIISWDEARTHSYDIYAQGFGPDGNPLWAEPIALASGEQTQRYSQLIATSDGNFVALWQHKIMDDNYYTQSIRAQKFNLLGEALWTQGGIILPTISNPALTQHVLANPEGGFYYVVQRSGDNPRHTAFSISATGNQLWGEDGVVIENVPDGLLENIVSDNSGGFIVCMRRTTQENSYLVRINSSGNVVGNNPMLAESPLEGYNYQIFPLLNGRYILYNYYSAQHMLRFCVMDAAGTLHGSVTAIFAGGGQTPQFSAHPDGGFYLVHPHTFAGGSQMGVRRYSSSGIAVWPAVKTYGSEIGAYTKHNIATDPQGDLTMIWKDQAQSTLLAQKIDSAGATLYPGESVTFSSGSRNPWLPALTVNQGQACMFWWEELGHQQLIKRQILSGTGQALLPENQSIISQALAGRVHQGYNLAVGDHYFSFWRDSRDGDVKIYLQKTDQNFNQLWEPGGRALNLPHADVESSTRIQCFDGENIAILYTCTEHPGYSQSVYLQLINQDGQALYAGLGTYICDGYSGMIGIDIGYEDGDYYVLWGQGGSTTWTLYGQRVHDGAALWQAGGKVIFQTDFSFIILKMDGRYLFWHYDETLDDDNGNRLVRLDQDGNVMDDWAPLGIPFFDYGEWGWEGPAAVERHEDFLYVITRGSRSNKMQKIGPDGSLPWGLAGKNISPLDDFSHPAAVSFGEETYVLFVKGNDSSNVQAHLQKVLRDGSLPWGLAGLSVYSGQYYCSEVQLMRFDNDFIVPVWTKSKHSTIDYDIWSAVIDPLGNLQATGLPLISAPHKQGYAKTAVLGNRGLITWIDQRIGYGTTYNDPQSLYAISFDASTLNADDPQIPGLAETPLLHQNYPNPFNPSTTISFSLPEAGTPRIFIYNLKGQLVRDLCQDASYPQGKHSITWDGKDSGGNSVCSGIYFCRLSFGGQNSSRKMILMK